MTVSSLAQPTITIPIRPFKARNDQQLVTAVRRLLAEAEERMVCQVAAEILQVWPEYTVDAEPDDLIEMFAPHIQHDTVKAVHDMLCRLLAAIELTEKTARLSQREGWVYLAHCDTGHYKIGWSVDPEKRIKHFDTLMPVTIRQVHTFFSEHALQAEAWLHALFADKRRTGEWFELEEEDVAGICAIYKWTDKPHVKEEDDPAFGLMLMGSFCRSMLPRTVHEEGAGDNE